MDKDKKIKELLLKVENGTATKEEKLLALKSARSAIEALRVLVDAAKKETRI